MSTASVLEGLRRLSESMKEIDDRKPSVPGHYQEIPNDIQQSYQLMVQGASLVHATSTKYTLVGKISADEQEKIASDLLKGCQFIGAGALVIGNYKAYGCGRSTRVHMKRACRAVLATVTNLVEAFFMAENGGGSNGGADAAAILEKDNNLAAQKCGLVWQTCDAFLNKKVPQGNRNAMRRDLFTWMMECNETMTEFQDLIDRGPTTADQKEETSQDVSFEDFCQDEGEQYSSNELEVATPCVALVKCSRGTINVALKASESAGGCLQKLSTADDDGDEDEKKKSVLVWIGTVHDRARCVGEGMTDLGTLLYPTLSLDEIEIQGFQQKQAILNVLDYVLDATDLDLSEEVLELATKLRAAAQTRHEELIKAIAAAR